MLKNLITLSASVALDTSAIQGAGGNTSVKDDLHMCVKASGTLLSEVSDSKGWAKVDLQSWRKDFSNFSSDKEDDFIQINTRNTLEGGFASIETGLHALLPHRYVLHTHSVYANILLCSGRTEDLITYIDSKTDVDIVVVPMCAPGLQLTTHLNTQLQLIKTTDKPILVLLENHGIAVSCNNLEQTITLHNLLHNGVRDYFKLPLFTSFTLTNISIGEQLINTQAFISDQKSWATDSNIPEYTSQFLKDPKVFFPDQVVYVNNKLNQSIVLKLNLLNNLCIVFPTLSEKQAKNTAAILAAVLYLYQNIQNQQTLPLELCNYISNMSGEKYRQQLEQ